MSSINPNNIDGAYPIAGQDNDSQGFRDNFTNIKNNFQFAYDEIADLQTKAVLKSALSGGSLSNDMAYAQLISPQFLKSVETINAISGTKTSNFTINWTDGNYQSFTLGGSLTLTLDSWPTSDLYARLRLQITTDGSGPYVLTLASGPTYVGVDVIQNTSGNAITLAASSTFLFEFTTADNGGTIIVQDLLRNYEIISTGTTGSFNSVLAGAVNARTIGNTGAFLTASTVAVGNISAVTIGNTGAAITGATVTATGNVIGGLAQFASINSTPVGNASASTGAFTTLSASGDSTFSGNVIRAGGQIDSGYQYSNVLANVGLTIGTNVSRLVLDPTQLVSTYVTVTLPGGNVDAKVVTISSTQTVQFLNVVTDNGTTLVNSGNITLSAGTGAQYFFHSSESKWYKIG